MNVLVIDVGGSHVKCLATGQHKARKFVSGPHMTAAQMVSGVRELVRGWQYAAVSIGYPGPARGNRAVADPPNLARGWVGFDFAAAFGCPVKLVNDAAMQALGSYRGGTLLFLGLGTGLGSAMVVDGVLVPMELAHLPYRNGTYEDYVGAAALEKRGKRKWRNHVADVVCRLVAALQPHDVVLGGGNVDELEHLPPGCRSVAAPATTPTPSSAGSGCGTQRPPIATATATTTTATATGISLTVATPPHRRSKRSTP